MVRDFAIVAFLITATGKDDIEQQHDDSSAEQSEDVELQVIDKCIADDDSCQQF